jgi:hypothetical protein
MTMQTKQTVVMRFDCPSAINYRLHNLASKLGVPVKDLLHDGINLALRFHGDGHGIPQPPVREPPVQESVVEDQVPVEMETPEDIDNELGGTP